MAAILIISAAIGIGSEIFRFFDRHIASHAMRIESFLFARLFCLHIILIHNRKFKIYNGFSPISNASAEAGAETKLDFFMISSFTISRLRPYFNLESSLMASAISFDARQSADRFSY